MPQFESVLQIHKFFFSRGGLERYLFWLNDLLERKGHKVVHMAMNDPRNRPTQYADYFVSPVSFPDRIEFANLLPAGRALARAIYSMEAYHKTRDLIAATRPAIAHVHEAHHHLSPSVLVALREAGIPAILHAHEYKLICPTVFLHDGKSVCEACKGHRYWSPILRRCSHGSLLRSTAAAAEATIHHVLGSYDERYIQVVVAGSKFVQEKLREFGVAEDRIALLPYLLDPAEWGDPERDPGNYFIFTGRLASTKGLPTMLRALVLAGDPPAVIAGDGPESERLLRMAQKLGLQNLKFTPVPAGPVSHDELRALLRGALGAIVPSESYETFGYAAYEAMGVARPVIASRLGALPELVRHGETGLLFEAGNAEDLAIQMRRLMDDPSAAQQMGNAARAEVERRTDPHAHYEKLMGIYSMAGAKVIPPGGRWRRRLVKTHSPPTESAIPREGAL
jgi:glycosyltransferase involved in cell wall biosynthesis